MAKTKMDVNEKDIDKMEDTVLDAMDKPVKEVVKGNLKKMREEALAYLNKLKELKKDIEDIEDRIKKLKEFRHQYSNKVKVPGRKKAVSEYELMDEYVHARAEKNRLLAGDIPKQLYESSFKFQKALNEFLGQKVTMVYVYRYKNQAPVLYEILNEDILKFGDASKSGFTARYKATQKQIENMLESKAIQQLETGNDFNFNLNNLNQTYDEVMFRFRKSKKVTGGHYIILWQNPLKTWHQAFISSEGDINEAYASIVLANRQEPSFEITESNILLQLELFVKDFIDEVLKVDSLPGALEGDLEMGEIEYGIKSAGASALGLQQLADLAKSIVEDENYSEEELLKKKKEFKENKQTRNKLLESLEDQVDKSIKEAIIDAYQMGGKRALNRAKKLTKN